MVPPVDVQVTAELYGPLPCTVAAHCEVPPAATADGLQFTDTEVIEDGIVGVPVDATSTIAEPVRLGCCVLAAVTVTLPPAAGAVSTPVAEMEPALADQVTAELYDPVPCTAAVHCAVPLLATEEGLQVTEIAVTVALCADDEAISVLPPQPANGIATEAASTANMTIGAFR